MRLHQNRLKCISGGGGGGGGGGDCTNRSLISSLAAIVPHAHFNDIIQGSERERLPSLLLPSLPPFFLPQVSKERVRVLEFMRDYDKLRSGRIPVTSFRRALDLCRFPLSQEEVAVLEERCVYSYSQLHTPAHVSVLVQY